MREIVGWTNDIRRNVGRERGDAQRKHGHHQDCWIGKSGEHIDRIPDCLPVNDRGRRRHRYANEGIKGHR
jgi:hypothetical protein